MKYLIALVLTTFLTRVALAEESIHLIMVNGMAEKAVDPNMTIVQIEIWGKSATAKEAQEIQARLFANVKTAIEKFKIKKEDFQTENFSINPEYFYDQKTQKNKITGYKVTHQVSAIYRRVDDAGVFIDSLATSRKDDTGGVNIQSISWDYDKKTAIESATLTEAVKVARAKAEELAKAAGVKIKSVHRIQHTSQSARVMSSGNNLMSSKASFSGSPQTELPSGQVKVQVSVQMEFEI
ncbi:MAG: SIMPL domain-containing protein [Pseudobdellovibrio sp.]